MTHIFAKSLEQSHAASDMPFWEECYRKAYPGMKAMIDHREDGWWQKAGIDRTVVLASSKVIRIDEKVRFKNYDDILLEIFSDKKRKTPGWAIKPLAADYIAYAFAKKGVCYLLPVIEMQRALQLNKEKWWKDCKHVKAENVGYTTLSIAVPTSLLLDAIKDMFLVSFRPMKEKQDVN